MGCHVRLSDLIAFYLFHINNLTHFPVKGTDKRKNDEYVCVYLINNDVITLRVSSQLGVFADDLQSSGHQVLRLLCAPWRLPEHSVEEREAEGESRSGQRSHVWKTKNTQNKQTREQSVYSSTDSQLCCLLFKFAEHKTTEIKKNHWVRRCVQAFTWYCVFFNMKLYHIYLMRTHIWNIVRYQ